VSSSAKRWIQGYEPWHLDALHLRWREEETFKLVDKDLDKLIKANQKGCAFTGFTEDSIIGSAGILPLWEGVGHAWVVFGADYRKHRIWIHRQVRNMFFKIAVGMKFRRVQANVQADFHEALRWIEALGFECESTLRQYGPDGKDHYMYTRFFE
tara:strand:+ start:3744 stop:4205 length:462 start_codon:yes stop_codon:yes gene_type:complete